MPFSPKDWHNDSAGGTPLNALALEDMEARLAAYADTKQTAGQKGQPNGYAGLNGDGVVPASQLPVESGGVNVHSIIAGNLGATYALDMIAKASVRLFGTLNVNCMLTVTAWKTGTSRAELVLKQDATGGRTLTINGTAVAIPTTANAASVIVLDTSDGGTTIVVSVPAAAGPVGPSGPLGPPSGADPAYDAMAAENFAFFIKPITVSNLRPTSGRLTGVKVPVPATLSATNVWLDVNQVGAGLTAGQNFIAIFDSSGTRLGITADCSTAWTSTGRPKSHAIVGGPITIAGGAGVFVYVVVLSVGTTTVGIEGLFTAGSTTFNGANGFATSWAVIAGGLTGQTAMPSSLVLANNVKSNEFFWAGLS